MGYMADFYLDQEMDINPSWFPFQETPHRYVKAIVCNRCGQQGLHWANSPTRHVLVNNIGAQHICKTAACDFEDLTK